MDIDQFTSGEQVSDTPEFPPVKENVTNDNAAVANRLASQLEAVDAAVQRRPLSLMSQAKKKSDIVLDGSEAVVAEGVQATTASELQDLADVAGGDDSLRTFAPEAMQSVIDAQKSPTALQTKYVNYLTTLPPEDDLHRAQVSKEYLAVKLDEAFSTEEDSWLDTGLNWSAAFLFPIDSLKDTYDFLPGGEGTLNEMRTWFQGLSPEDQIRIAPAIISSIQDATEDNPFKGQHIAGKVFATASGEATNLVVGAAFDTLLSTVDVVSGVGLARKAVTSTATGVSGLVRARQQANAVKTMSLSMDKAETLADINIAMPLKENAGTLAAQIIKQGPTSSVGKAVNVSDFSANQSLSGFSNELLNAGTTDNLAEQIIPAIETKAASLGDALRSAAVEERSGGTISDGFTLNRPQLLDEAPVSGGEAAITDVQRDAARKKVFDTDEWQQRMFDVSLRADINPTIKPVFIEDTLEGFRVQTRDIQGNLVETVLKFQKSDIGEFTETVIGSGSAIWSPNVWLKSNAHLAKVATSLGMKKHKSLAIFGDQMKGIRKGMNSKDSAGLDTVLSQGNKDGVVYTREQLTQTGIVSPEGRSYLSSAQADAYYKTRELSDWQWRQANALKWDEMNFERFKSVDLTAVSGELSSKIGFGKIVAKDVAAPTGRIFDSEAGSLMSVADVQKKLKSSEYVVVRLSDTVKHGDKSRNVEYFDNVLIKASEIKPLPKHVLRYHKGYVPVLRENVNFVSRVIQRRVVNGVKTKGEITLGLHTSEADAAKFLDNYKSNNPDIDPKNYTIKKDRELDPDDKTTSQASGSLITSSRSSREIYEGVGVERASPVKALGRQMGHIATHGNINNYRLTAIEAFEKTYGKFLINPHAGEGNSWTRPVKSGVDPEVAQSLNRVREYIKSQVGVSTEAERAMSAKMQRLGEAVEGSKAGRLFTSEKQRRALMNGTMRHPASAIKSSVYHTTLGGWNPAQLAIQGSGISVAASLHPIQALTAVPRYFALKAMGMSDTVAVGGLDTMAKAMGLPVKDAKALHIAYSETGITDSFKSLSDFDAQVRTGLTDASVVSKLFETNLMFVKEGENFNRSIGYLVASQNHAKKIGKSFSQFKTLDWKKVNERGVELSLNMHRANAAEWQKGWLGVPTQYKAVIAKYLETVTGMNGAFTRTERLKLVAGQIAIFGSSGVPFGAFFVGGVVAAMGIDAASLPKEQQIALREGVISSLFYAMTDTEFSISNRVALQASFEEMIGFFSGDVSFGEAFIGPAGMMGSRAWDASARIAAVSSFEMAKEFPRETFIVAIDEVMKITSTWRGIQQARLWDNLGYVTDNKGNKLFPLEDGDGVVTAKFWGFNPSRVNHMYKAKDFLKAKSQEVADVRNAVRQLKVDYLSKMSDAAMSNEDFVKHTNYHHASVSMLLSSLPIEQRAEIRAAIAKEFITNKSQLNETYKKLVDYYISTGDSSNLNTSAALAERQGN
jgi:hypothetical protein